MSFIQSQQEEARKIYIYHVTQEDSPVFTPDILDSLISQVVQNTVEEVEKKAIVFNPYKYPELTEHAYVRLADVQSIIKDITKEV